MDEEKLTYIFLISRYLQKLSTEKVRAVFCFVQAYADPELFRRRRSLLRAQQNQGFAESGGPSRKLSKSDENGGLPDLLTVLLDRRSKP